jgi:HEAT repeat protein
MRMMRWVPLVLFAVALATLGCSGAPTAPAKTAAKKPKKSEPKKLDIQPVEVKADEFASVEEALTELDRVLEMPDGDDRNRAEIRVQNWLAMQGGAAVPLVAQRASDAEQSIARRITACRILGKLGPGGVDTLIEIAAKGDSSQLRRKAIETLGIMRPAEKRSINALIAHLDDADTQVQWQTIDALIKIGEPAQAAASKLNELRQSHADESIRVSAGEALKKVDPRKTFVD